MSTMPEHLTIVDLYVATFTWYGERMFDTGYAIIHLYTIIGVFGTKIPNF